MIGIDSNVLIRYIVQDDQKQAHIATNFLETFCKKETPGFVNHIVLCEIIWVLNHGYNYPKDILIKVIKQLLSNHDLIVEDVDSAWAAFRDYVQGKADYSDYLIAHRNKQQGCTTSISFDKKANQHPLFTDVKTY